jgi:hypothetical protein
MDNKLTPRDEYERATPEPLDVEGEPKQLEGTSPVITLAASLLIGVVILAIAMLIGVLK